MKLCTQACNPENKSHKLLPIIVISRSASPPFLEQILKFSTALVTRKLNLSNWQLLYHTHISTEVSNRKRAIVLYEGSLISALPLNSHG